MKNYLFLFVLIASCAVTKPPAPPIPNPAPIPIPKPTPQPVVIDTIHVVQNSVSILDFGAKCDGVTDDIIADSMACAFCITNPKICTIVTFPVGNSIISRPLILSNHGAFFTLKILGSTNNKSSSDAYLSKITYTGRAGYGIGIQLGRSIEIENITLLGQYTFPNTINNANIGTTTFAQWNDGSVTDSRYAPYAGISIDPDPNANGSQGGTSDVTIKNCSIRQWMVGICLTPNGTTANDEMINIIDDDIESDRVAIAIGQDQSKEIHIDRLKCWASTHTILDGVTYGRGTGGGSVMIDGMNIAGNVNQLFNIVNDRFPLSANNIYGESIFRIGTVGGRAGANITNAEIDFLSGPGMPEADYLISGWANFYGGSLRYYDNDPGHRLSFVNTYSMFRDMTLSSEPITAGLYGIPQNVYSVPQFANVMNYNNTAIPVQTGKDTVILIPRGYTLTFNNWTATMSNANVQVGDYILASGRGCYDAPTGSCPTIQIGRVISITNGISTLTNVGLNAPKATYDNLFIDRMK